MPFILSQMLIPASHYAVCFDTESTAPLEWEGAEELTAKGDNHDWRIYGEGPLGGPLQRQT